MALRAVSRTQVTSPLPVSAPNQKCVHEWHMQSQFPSTPTTLVLAFTFKYEYSAPP
jgi:hypothetical protein